LKKLFCLIITLSILFCTFTAQAKNREFNITTPKGFTSAEADGDKTKLANVFSTTEAELERYFKENSILYIAANEGYSQQIFLTKETTEFSKKTISFTRISEKDLSDIAVSLAGNSFENGGVIIGKENTPFIKLTLKDSGEFKVYEYITVCSSNLYTLRISTNQNNEQELIESFFKTLSITDCATVENSTTQSAYTVIAAAGIAVFAAVAVIVTYTVIRDIKRRNSSDFEEYAEDLKETEEKEE